jgi:hypothetical protein
LKKERDGIINPNKSQQMKHLTKILGISAGVVTVAGLLTLAVGLASKDYRVSYAGSAGLMASSSAYIAFGKPRDYSGRR